jgi:hypothetical protein
VKGPGTLTTRGPPPFDGGEPHISTDVTAQVLFAVDDVQVVSAVDLITTGDQKGEFLPLGRRTNVIGRAENLPLQIRDDLIGQSWLFRLTIQRSIN